MASADQIVTEAQTATAPGRPEIRKVRGQRRRGNVAWGIVGWVVGIVFFFPVLWMVLTGFKHGGRRRTRTPPTVFFTPTLEQFSTVFSRASGPYVANSVFATIVSDDPGAARWARPCAFALSLRPVRKTQDVLFFFMSTKMLPIVAAIIPMYVIARNLGLLDNIWTLVILYTSMNLPIAVWMMRSFFLEVPGELLEAAQLDGAPPAARRCAR